MASGSMEKSAGVDRFIDADEDTCLPLPPIKGYEKKLLVSLEEAVQGLKTLVHDLDRQVQLAKQNSSNPADGLTVDESAAIRLYTMPWPKPHKSICCQLNNTLRSDLRRLLIPWFSYLKLFVTALTKLPSTKKTIWRGVRHNVSYRYSDKNCIWWGFSSCTESKDVLEQCIGDALQRTALGIECVTGKSIRNHSCFSEWNEILLMPGTYLSVMDKKRLGNGLYEIYFQETTAPDQLIASFVDLSLSSVEPLPLVQANASQASSQVALKQPDVPSETDNTSSPDTQEMTQERKMLIFPSPHDNVLPKDIPIVQPPRPSSNEETVDRVVGSLIGLAVGDALGASVEFRPRDYLLQHPVLDMQGGGTWGLTAGQWTDDTSMALCLAASLITKKGFDPYHQMVCYKWWYKHGFLSSTGHCFDIGSATRQSLDEFIQRQNRLRGPLNCPTDDQLDQLSYESVKNVPGFNVNCSSSGVAGNGALMRLTPIPLFYYRSPVAAVEYAGRSAILTHGDQKAGDACRYYAALIVAAVRGASKESILSGSFYNEHRDWFSGKELHSEVLRVAKGSYKKPGGYADGIRGKGYIVDALEAALWAFWSDKGSFKTGVLAAVNLGDDADTTAAIYGQLAGAHYGYRGIPENWRKKQLYAHDLLVCIGRWLHFLGDKKDTDHQQPQGTDVHKQNPPITSHFSEMQSVAALSVAPQSSQAPTDSAHVKYDYGSQSNKLPQHTQWTSAHGGLSNKNSLYLQTQSGAGSSTSNRSSQPTTYTVNSTYSGATNRWKESSKRSPTSPQSPTGVASPNYHPGDYESNESRQHRSWTDAQVHRTSDNNSRRLSTQPGSILSTTLRSPGISTTTAAYSTYYNDEHLLSESSQPVWRLDVQDRTSTTNPRLAQTQLAARQSMPPSTSRTYDGYTLNNFDRVNLAAASGGQNSSASAYYPYNAPATDDSIIRHTASRSTANYHNTKDSQRFYNDGNMRQHPYN